MVDIIIPVFNTPINDLERCLESVLNQNYKDWHVILVDDGSRGGIAKWLDMQYGTDERFDIIHTVNGGVSSARNLGLEYASGEYLVFCDSDDALLPDFLSQAVVLMEKYSLDLVIGSCQIIDDIHIERIGCKSPFKELWLYKNEQIESVIDCMLTTLLKQDNQELGSISIWLGSVCARVYRRGKFDNILFDNEVRMAEDLLYNLECMLRCEKIGIVSEEWYKYFQNDYSATHKDRKIIMKQQIEFSYAIDRYRIQCREANLENALNICMLWKMYYCLHTICFEEEKQKRKMMCRIMQMDIFNNIKNVDVTEYVGISRRKKIYFSLVKIRFLRLKVVSLQLFYYLLRTLSNVKHFIFSVLKQLILRN